MDGEVDALRRRLLIASLILAEQQLQLQRQAARRQMLLALIRNQIAQQMAFCLYLAVFGKPNRALARREPRIRVRAVGLQRLPLYRRPVRLYWKDYRYDTASCLDSTRFTPEELDELAQLIAEPDSQARNLFQRNRAPYSREENAGRKPPGAAGPSWSGVQTSARVQRSGSDPCFQDQATRSRASLHVFSR